MTNCHPKTGIYAAEIWAFRKNELPLHRLSRCSNELSDTYTGQRTARHPAARHLAGGVLRLRHRSRLAPRGAGPGGTGPLLRAPDIQGYPPAQCPADTQQPGAGGRRPERLHQQGAHRLLRQRDGRPHVAGHRPAHRHRLRQHLPAGGDRQGGGGGVRRDRELQRLARRTHLRRV